MEKCQVCKCSPCNCSSRCSHILAPLAVLVLAIVVLLANLNVISAHLSSILWPILLGLAAIFKMCACKKGHGHCHCGCHQEKRPM
jgi:hypothetical protein